MTLNEYRIDSSNKFTKSLANYTKKDGSIVDKIKIFLEYLITGNIPAKYSNHKLTGKYKGKEMWDAHIKPNLVLVYKIDRANKIITLEELGSHSDLFEYLETVKEITMKLHESRFEDKNRGVANPAYADAIRTLEDRDKIRKKYQETPKAETREEKPKRPKMAPGAKKLKLDESLGDKKITDREKALLLRVAQENNPGASISTLDTRNSNSLDFYELSIWGIAGMLEKAYLLGKRAHRADRKVTENVNRNLARSVYNVYKDYGVEIIEHDGKVYVCNDRNWNGEKWSDCFEVGNDLEVVANGITIRPIYKPFDPEEDVQAEIDTYVINESMFQPNIGKESSYRNIPGVVFVDKGWTNDPILKYKDKKLNYYDVDDSLWDIFVDELGTKTAEEGDFDKWLQQNHGIVYDLFDNCEGC